MKAITLTAVLLLASCSTAPNVDLRIERDAKGVTRVQGRVPEQSNSLNFILSLPADLLKLLAF